MAAAKDRGRSSDVVDEVVFEGDVFEVVGEVVHHEYCVADSTR